jgi:hypothetical protein
MFVIESSNCFSMNCLDLHFWLEFDLKFHPHKAFLMKLSHSLLSILLTSSLAISVYADSAATGTSRTKTTTLHASAPGDRDWTLEAGSGIYVSDIRDSNMSGYTILPLTLTASYNVDDISLDNFLGGACRGHTEFFFRAHVDEVLHGLEPRFIGANFGPRYNFCQQGWPVVPFVEGNVGFAFTESQGITTVDRGHIGQGQDFCFQFGIGLGVRYDINDDWFLRLTGTYKHYSNAGLSEPGRRNNSIDAAGPELTLGYRF